MSSITAYESDNLTVVTAEWEWIGSPEGAIQTIRIHLAMLINGKIKNIYTEMPIEKKLFKDPDEAEDSDEKTELLNRVKTQYWYTLVDWTAWNTLLDIIKQLGYGSDIQYRDIEHWLEKLYIK